MTDSFASFIDAVKVMRDREAAELRRIMTNPEMLDVATLFTDRLLDSLKVLCNYEYVVDGHGKRWPILDLDQRLCDAVCAEFYRLTGQDYKPTVLRTVEFRNLTQKGK